MGSRLRLNDEQLAELVANYQAGVPMRVLEEQIGRHRSVIRDALVRAGRELRRTGRPRPFAGREDELVSDYLAGMSQQALADKYGTNRTTVHNVLVERGALGQRQSLTPAEAGELVAAYLAGASLDELMKRFKIGRRTVHDYLDRAGCQRRPSGRPRRSRL